MRSLRRCPVRTYLVRTGTYRSLGRSGRSSGAVSVRIVALLVLGFCCFQRTGLGQRTSLVFFRQTRWIRMHRSSRRLNCANYLHGDAACMERWWELLASRERTSVITNTIGGGQPKRIAENCDIQLYQCETMIEITYQVRATNKSSYHCLQCIPKLKYGC